MRSVISFTHERRSKASSPSWADHDQRQEPGHDPGRCARWRWPEGRRSATRHCDRARSDHACQGGGPDRALCWLLDRRVSSELPRRSAARVDLTVIDVGVLIAVLDADDAHHGPARRALSEARARGDRLVVPASAYAELLVAPLRRGSSGGQAIDAFLDALPADIEPATRDIARHAAGLRAKHGTRLRLPDALVVATAIGLEADRLLTTDGRWREVPVRIEAIGS
jgi:predicted nucleic acid-binding protein